VIAKFLMAAFVLLLVGLAGYVIFVQPARARRAMAVLGSKGLSLTDPGDPSAKADVAALLPLPNYRIFIASEKTQGPFTLRSVWTSQSSRSYYALLTRWQRSPIYNVEQGARENEELSQTCYIEHIPRLGRPVLFVGYGIQSRGVVDLERYHGMTEVRDGLDPAFAKVFSVFGLAGETGELSRDVQRALLLHADYLRDAPFASLKFSAEGWGFCRNRIVDADAFHMFMTVSAEISAAYR